MDVVELTMWDTELLQTGPDMCLDLGRLASNSLLGPGSYLLLQAIPYKFVGYKFSCSAHRRV